ncbi:MAG: alpha/beta hydrolase, partial [Acidiferrobacteraceae bacterium]|nr:alpha/beta hydrolase [Acidiferrobacteraceae bacterium]
MNRPRFSLIPVMDHEIHITEWGDPDKPSIVMWHGLARTGRDFDELAAALSDEFFVLCPDTIGRGLSSWSKDPEREYTLEYYT